MAAPASQPDFRIASVKDFTVRKRSAGLMELFLICATISIIGFGMSLGLYDKLAVLSLLYTVGGFVSLYISLKIRKNHYLVQSTEFLNALFSSALGMHYKFAMIVKSDGKVVYFNRPFQDIFSTFIQSTDRSLKNWLKLGGAPDDAGDKIMNAVTQENNDKVIAQMKSGLYAITIESIPRPSGFVLVRGRELTEAG